MNRMAELGELLQRAKAASGDTLIMTLIQVAVPANLTRHKCLFCGDGFMPGSSVYRTDWRLDSGEWVTALFHIFCADSLAKTSRSRQGEGLSNEAILDAWDKLGKPYTLRPEDKVWEWYEAKNKERRKAA